MNLRGRDVLVVEEIRLRTASGQPSLTRPTNFGLSHSERVGGMPELPSARLLPTAVCTETATNQLEQLPPDIRNPIYSFCQRGEQLLRIEVEIVGKPSATGWSRRKLAPST